MPRIEMPQNIEIKCRLTSLAEAHRIAEEVSGGPAELIDQVDIFYHSEGGRLKLRVFGEESGELIFYRRPDQAGPKLSNYSIFPTDSPASLDRVLAPALGVRGTVKKRRWLYRVGQTRIHLDEVEGLGCFLEFEVVLAESQDPDEGREIANQLIGRFGLSLDRLVEQAYIDLLYPDDGG
ncbi:MAG TPA: class IV adenylate cyclase [Anaerolineales bacterium]|nr:class IV adenylate cyclase [Anaerolineales bacterium]